MLSKSPSVSAREWLNRRRSPRYVLTKRVDILKDGAAIGTGELIDISNGGAAFKSFSPLNVGMVYRIIIKDIGTYDTRIVRRFKNYHFGVEFSISDYSRHRLSTLLEDLKLESAED